jgi:hypothetical protein
MGPGKISCFVGQPFDNAPGTNINDRIQSVTVIDVTSRVTFRLRGNLGEEIVDIEYISKNGSRKTLASNKKLPQQWTTMVVPETPIHIMVTFKNDRVYNGKDRNVLVDTASFRSNDVQLKPYIYHDSPQRQHHIVMNRNRAHERGIFAWNGVYHIILSDASKSYSTVPGLSWKMVQGYFAENPSFFNSGTIIRTGSGVQEFNDLYRGTGGAIRGEYPKSQRKQELYSIEWVGYFLPKKTGKHTFYTDSDDASFLWIGNTAASGYTTSNALVKNPGIRPMRVKSGSVNLQANTPYPIRIQFGENRIHDEMRVSFTEPGRGRTYDFTGYVFSVRSGGTTPVQGKRVRLDHPKGTINLAEIEIYDTYNRNIAPSAKITMSSVTAWSNGGKQRSVNDPYFGTGVAVDGQLSSGVRTSEPSTKKDPKYGAFKHHMIHTNGPGWIEFEFSQETDISKVVIYNRDFGCDLKRCSDRILGCTVSIVNTNGIKTYAETIDTVENVYVVSPRGGCPSYSWKNYWPDATPDEEQKRRQRISQCFSQGGCYDDNKNVCTPQISPTTTAAPTTAAPITTTAAPITTTAAPITTTAAPITTTAAPITTTAAPITTTAAPTTSPPATCPTLDEGETVLHSEDGSLYRVQSEALRQYPTMEIYRSWGSPNYRVIPGAMLDACPKGPPMNAKTTQAPTTQAPDPVDQGPTMDPTLYLFIHQDTYDMEGKLHVLAARFGSLILEPYRQRELSQIFFTNSMGMLRNGAGQGEYVEHNEGCLAPVLTRSPGDESTWQIRNTGKHQYSYRITSTCGSPLHSEPGSTVVDLATSTSGTSWYVIPVGTASFS